MEVSGATADWLCRERCVEEASRSKRLDRRSASFGALVLPIASKARPNARWNSGDRTSLYRYVSPFPRLP